MKHLSKIIAVLTICALIIWGYTSLQSNKKIIDEKATLKEQVVTILPVRTALAQMLEIDNKLELSGSFRANKEISVFAEGQGRITGLFIAEGQQVRKGQRVAKLDDASIQVQLNTAKAQLDKLDNDIASYKRLLEAGAVSKSQLEEIVLSRKNAEANIAAINQQFAYTTAFSPLSGIVKEVPVEVGSFASPGMKLATIVDVNQLKMIVKVPEEDVVKLNNGLKVDIVADVYPDHTFKGFISLIGIQADEGRKYDVEINVANSTKRQLKPGMYGRVIIPTSQTKETALFVPRKSIIGSVKNPQVYIVEGNLAKLVNIKVGEIHDDNVKVIDGLAVGQQVVTIGQQSLKDGAQIKILNDNAIMDSDRSEKSGEELSIAQ